MNRPKLFIVCIFISKLYNKKWFIHNRRICVNDKIFIRLLYFSKWRIIFIVNSKLTHFAWIIEFHLNYHIAFIKHLRNRIIKNLKFIKANHFRVTATFSIVTYTLVYISVRYKSIEILCFSNAYGFNQKEFPENRKLCNLNVWANKYPK